MVYKFREEKITVKGKVNLGATIAIPENAGEKLPAIVLVVGTGKGDRDGNMAKFKLNIYKDLAHFLTGLGFVTIRYDKRGVGESEGNHTETSFTDLVDDIITNVEYLRDQGFVDKVILCGHSEGSMLVAVANEKCPVDGLIQIAGAGMCIRKALEYQNYGLLQEIKTLKGPKGLLLRRLITENNYLKNVNALLDKCNSTDKDVIRFKGTKTPAKWFRQHDSFTDESMQELMKNAKCPILAITGGKDVQADPKYIDIINGFNMDHIKGVVVPNIDHLMKENKKEITILNLMKQYKKEVGQPLSTEFLGEIEQWLLENFITTNK